MLDKSNEVHDRKLASHILNMYSDEAMNDPTELNPLIDRDTLARYISFARKYVHPVISDEAAEELVKSYVDMRRMGTSKNIITATPR